MVKKSSKGKFCLSEKPIPWFRMYSDSVDDEKLRMLAFEDRWHFFAILCCKAKGIIDGKSRDLLFRRVSVKLGLSVRELEEVARRLDEVELIDKETLQPLSWDKRQFLSDTDPTNAERQKRFRNSEKTRNALRNGAVTRTEEELEIEEELEEEKTSPARKRSSLSIDVYTGEIDPFAEVKK